MKTTIDIPDVLYRRVKLAAVQNGTTVRELMINGLRKELEGVGPAAHRYAREEKALYETNELGFVVLKRSKRSRPVTDKMVNTLREREGV